MIRLIKPYINFDEVKSEFQDIFESGWFTKGKFVEEFKHEIKSYTGSNHAFLTTSATTALTMSLKILNIKKGDEVIVSDFSFPATANVIEDLEAIPIFCDVSLETFNMKPNDFEKKITSKTKAVIFVDALGNPSGIGEIKNICKKYNLPLIEDAACSIGSSENNIKCGNIADLTCFSFHPRKLLTTGEGGAITTNNKKYAELLDIKLNHGAVINDGKFDFVDYGYNYRMSELQAVMGIKQLKKLDIILKSRNNIRDLFIVELQKIGFSEQKLNKNVVYNVQSLVFKVPQDINRDNLIKHLKINDIETTIGTYSLSIATYYYNKYQSIKENSYYLENNTITFPCYENLDTKRIFDVIVGYVNNVR